MAFTTKTKNCPLGYRCAKTWSSLKETPDPLVKYCSDCDAKVHWVHDLKELASASSKAQCVCFNVKMVKNNDGGASGLGDLAARVRAISEEELLGYIGF